jgi:RNase P/RNase MRP subunit p29
MKKWERRWENKKEKCIFRGSATGCGITVETNTRLRVADMSIDNGEILDAGITDWNARMKKYINQPIRIIDINGLGFGLSNKISNSEKSNYKYILNIDGHVSAFRLSSELGMNSVILLVKSKYYTWFMPMLKEYTHYVPIKDDLSDLIDRIEWCIQNDDKCKDIAKNAYQFFLIHINKKGIFDYMENQLHMIHFNRDTKNLLGMKISKKKIAIITLFRDNGNGQRIKERKAYIEIMSSIMKNVCEYHIYIIEQSQDGELFNIGKLKNIGFEIASKNAKYDNYIFSDIDTIPNYDLLPYFLKKEESIVSLAARGTRYPNKIHKPFLGALIGCNEKIFKKINGYPNNFWGWGGEDDSLLIRLHQEKINKIMVPKEGSTIDIEENDGKSVNIVTKIKVLLKNKKDELKFEKLYWDIENYKTNGINSLQYKILETNKINENTTQIKVDLLKKIDMKEKKEWFPLRNINYLEKEKIIKNIYKNMKNVLV